MKVYTCTGFAGFWPVGTSAVVVADTPEGASALLNAALKERGLDGDSTAASMREVKTEEPNATILCDGNY